MVNTFFSVVKLAGGLYLCLSRIRADDVMAVIRREPSGNERSTLLPIRPVPPVTMQDIKDILL